MITTATDSQTFEQASADFLPRLRKTIQRKYHDYDFQHLTIEDFHQEAIIGIWQHWQKNPDCFTQSSYKLLYVIARNYAYKKLLKNARKRNRIAIEQTIEPDPHNEDNDYSEIIFSTNSTAFPDTRKGYWYHTDNNYDLATARNALDTSNTENIALHHIVIDTAIDNARELLDRTPQPAKAHQAFEMWLNGYGCVRIGKALGMGTTTVHRHLQPAKKHLLATLSHVYPHAQKNTRAIIH